MRCPQCGAETPDDRWNCIACRMNLYWASQHYEGLAEIRERAGLPVSASPAPFLVKAHMDAMAERGEPVENRVRALAWKVMHRESAPPGSTAPEPDDPDPAEGAPRQP